MYRALNCLAGSLLCLLGMVRVDALAEERQIAHMVFFKVVEEPADATDKLVAACEKYLSDHEGTVYFSVAVRAEEMDRDVNATDFDVALHLVFQNKAALDKYADHPRHVEFIEENKELWSAVRVFDSYVMAASKPAAQRVVPRLRQQRLVPQPAEQVQPVELEAVPPQQDDN